MKKMILINLFMVLALSAFGQISLTTIEGEYAEGFDGIGASGTTFPTGWTAIRASGSGTLGATLSMAVSTGSDASGNIYNVGTAAAPDRALGTLGSGTTIPAFGASFVNNTGVTITSIDFNGVMEQWKSGSSTAVNERVIFEYSTNATALNNGIWTAFSSMDLVEVLTATVAAAAVDGNLPANQLSISGTVSSLNIANGATFWIRWTDANDTGSDGMYAIDNFSLTPFTSTVLNDGDGFAVLTNSDASSLAGTDIFKAGHSSSSITLNLTGVATGTLTDISVTLPSGWTGLQDGLVEGDVTLGGTAFTSASKSVSGNVITITNAGLTDLAFGTVTISNPTITTPDPSVSTSLNGNYTFTVKTAKSGGTLTDISSSPKAFVVIPIANIKDQDANEVPLDLGVTIATTGTASVSNNVFSFGDLDANMEDGSNGVSIYMVGGAATTFIQGTKYIVKGTIDQLSGKTRVKAATATDIIADGIGSLPANESIAITIDALVASTSIAESFEGKLVTIKNATISGFTTSATTSNYVNLTINDGSVSTITLRVNATTSDTTGLVGSTHDIVGIFNQFDSSSPYTSGYQFFSRSAGDYYPANTLPVELSSFTVSASGKNALLKWETTTETNNAGFEVLRNGQSVGFVSGNGTTTEKQSYLFTDKNVSGKVSYQLKQVDTDGKTSLSQILSFIATPVSFEVSGNYPNPFNPSTVIKFNLPEVSTVVVKVHNIIGQEIATLVNGKMDAGVKEVRFDATGLSSGIYFYSVSANGKTFTKSMTLMK